MFKYCLKVFDFDDCLKMQIIVPVDELFENLEKLSSYGTVKGYIINEDNN